MEERPAGRAAVQKPAQRSAVCGGAVLGGNGLPGDMVSLLVIARLPFPVPDPVSEAEKKQYPSLQDYIQAVVVPGYAAQAATGVWPCHPHRNGYLCGGDSGPARGKRAEISQSCAGSPAGVPNNGQYGAGGPGSFESTRHQNTFAEISLYYIIYRNV